MSDMERSYLSCFTSGSLDDFPDVNDDARIMCRNRMCCWICHSAEDSFATASWNSHRRVLHITLGDCLQVLPLHRLAAARLCNEEHCRRDEGFAVSRL